MEITQLKRFDRTTKYQPGIWQTIGDVMPQISLRTSSPDQPPRYLFGKTELKQKGSNAQSGGYLAPYSKGFSAETEENLFDSTDIKPRILGYLFDDVARPPEDGYMMPRLEDSWNTKVLTEQRQAQPKLGFFSTPDLDISNRANYGSTLIYGGAGRMGSDTGPGGPAGPDGSGGPGGPGAPSGGGVVEPPPTSTPGPLNPGQCGGGNF